MALGMFDNVGIDNVPMAECLSAEGMGRQELDCTSPREEPAKGTQSIRAPVDILGRTPDDRPLTAPGSHR